MQDIHIERLRTLYSVMAGIPNAAIEMDQWRRGRRGGTLVTDERLMQGCGTAACALGWACAYPEFKEQGLRSVGKSDSWGERSTVPTFESAFYMEAGAKFFGITKKQSNLLFSAPSLGERLSGNDKQVFLHRLRQLMLDEGIITPKRNAELQAEEDARDETEDAAVPA